MSTPTVPETGAPPAPRGVTLTWLALGVALLATWGSLYLSMRMGLVACSLCFYQRTFVLSAAGVLVMGVLAGLERTAPLGLLALPLAVAGTAIGGFHVYLEMVHKLECPRGILDLGTAPQQAVAIQALLSVLLLADALRPGGRGAAPVTALFALVVGGLLAYGSIASAPKLAGPPKTQYKEKKIKVCRPPYVAP
jgi:disulfide bond formation protein DsbB